MSRAKAGLCASLMTCPYSTIEEAVKNLDTLRKEGLFKVSVGYVPRLYMLMN